MNNKKKLMISAVSALGVAVIGFGAYAYFSDEEAKTTSGTIGTVDVTMTDITMTHTYNGQPAPNNINPGDNDPDENNDTGRPGTDHEFSFTVNNEGSKSVMTRQIIKVTGTKVGGAALTSEELLNVIISEKLGDGALVREVADNTEANALYYVIGGNRDMDVMNGYGDNAEIETVATGTSITKTFDLGLDKDLGTADKSDLEGATINISVEVQAMQYRNTDDDDWNTLGIKDFDFTYGGTEG